MWAEVSSTCAEDWYRCAKDFQTAATGISGFLGVIATLFTTAYLQRKAVKDQRRHEANRLRTALKSELETIHDMFVRNVERLSPLKLGSSGSFLFPIKPINDVFTLNLQNIGILSAKEIKAIIEAHASYETFLNGVAIIGRPVEDLPNHISVDSSQGLTVAEMSDNMVIKIAFAIKCIPRSLDAE